LTGAGYYMPAKTSSHLAAQKHNKYNMNNTDDKGAKGGPLFRGDPPLGFPRL